MELPIYSWQSFSDLCITEKGLHNQYADLGRSYRLIGPDAKGITWIYDMPKKLEDGQDNPEVAEFLAVAATFNKKIEQASADGVPQVNSIPAVDSKMACFCPPAAKEVTPADSYVDYAIEDTYVQMAGIIIEVEGAEAWDALKFQVGYMAGQTWVTVNEYGGKILITPEWKMSYLSPLRSNALPEGLILRVSYIFKNAETTNKPKVSVMYHLWRPYGA